MCTPCAWVYIGYQSNTLQQVGNTSFDDRALVAVADSCAGLRELDLDSCQNITSVSFSVFTNKLSRLESLCLADIESFFYEDFEPIRDQLRYLDRYDGPPSRPRVPE